MLVVPVAASMYVVLAIGGVIFSLIAGRARWVIYVLMACAGAAVLMGGALGVLTGSGASVFLWTLFFSLCAAPMVSNTAHRGWLVLLAPITAAAVLG